MRIHYGQGFLDQCWKRTKWLTKCSVKIQMVMKYLSSNCFCEKKETAEWYETSTAQREKLISMLFSSHYTKISDRRILQLTNPNRVRVIIKCIFVLVGFTFKARFDENAVWWRKIEKLGHFHGAAGLAVFRSMLSSAAAGVCCWCPSLTGLEPCGLAWSPDIECPRLIFLY